jgi:transposase
MKKNDFIGIDVSKLTLDVALYSEKGNCKENYMVVPNNPQGYTDFIKWLKEKEISCKDVFICMEHTGVYTLNFQHFLEKKKIIYRLENPLQIKKSMGIIRGKDDKIDAYRIAQYCFEKRDKLTPSFLPSTSLQKLQRLLSERKCYVRDIARFKQIQKEVSIYEDTASKRRKQKSINMLGKLLEEIEKQIMEVINVEKELQKNYLLLTSIKGIGFVNAVNTIVFTNNFTAFDNARSYACYVGVAPFPNRSGSTIKGKTTVSKLGNKMLKSELSQAARCAIVHDMELRKYFQRKYKEKGATRDVYGIVLNAVKFKLIGRIFAVIKRQTPYVERAF